MKKQTKQTDETIKAFQRMTNEVIKELEGKKSEFNKMFSQLMGTVPESAKQTLEQVKNNVIESINKEIEVATQAEKILEEGIKKVSRRYYENAKKTLLKNLSKHYKLQTRMSNNSIQKAKEITSISKEIESGGMLSLDAGKKNDLKVSLKYMMTVLSH
ncbi:hypothetical protein ACT7DN_00330 [Bacillus paranthracis]